MIGSRRSWPAKFESAFHDSEVPGSGKIAPVTGILCLALSISFLDKCPHALPFDEKVAAVTMVDGDESGLRVIGNPFGEVRELR